MKTSTKKILVAAATHWELRAVKQLWNSQPSKNMTADFLQTGIGNINSSLHLTQSLSQNSYDFVINIWVCWYSQTQEPLIQIIRSIYHPTGRELLTPVFFEFAPLKSICCSETPITDAHALWDEYYVDMESYAVEKVCEYFAIPRLILKVPIDKVWVETESFDYTSACTTLWENIDIKQLKNSLEKYLSTLSEKYDISTYLSHYHFTASEKIIFEKYFHKYITLSNQDFDTFFTTHKNLEKTNFLQQFSEALTSLSHI